MKYTKFPYVKNDVSKIVFGTAIPVFLEGTEQNELLSAAYDMGITTFDTARSYGQCETEFGKWIAKRGVREKINILTKGCNPDQTGVKFTPEILRGELTKSLEELQTGYTDLYALHRDDPTVPVEVFIETLNEFKAEGKVRAFGASNWKYQRMDAANEYAYAHNLEGFSFGSPAFSLAVVVRDPYGGSVHLSGDENKEARKWFMENNIPVFAYSSFARGFMSGKYRTDMKESVTEILSPWTCQEYVCEENLERLRRAEKLAAEKGITVGQVNLAWILAQPLTCCPIFSPSTVEHLLENLKGLDVKLTEEEIMWLNLK